jgi:uncharacterized RDD family membrane protein YckC
MWAGIVPPQLGGGPCLSYFYPGFLHGIHVFPLSLEGNFSRGVSRLRDHAGLLIGFAWKLHGGLRLSSADSASLSLGTLGLVSGRLAGREKTESWAQDAGFGRKELTMEKAGFFTRFLAIFIDGLILVPVVSGIGYIANNQSAGFPVQLIYETLLISQWNGQTIGKKIMGIHVVTSSGAPINILKAFIRNLSRYLSAFILLVGYFWMLWDKDSQTWHDKIADTYVVKS